MGKRHENQRESSHSVKNFVICRFLMQNVKYTHYTPRQLPALLPVVCLLNCAKEQRAGFRLHCSDLPTFCPASGLNLLAG